MIKKIKFLYVFLILLLIFVSSGSVISNAVTDTGVSAINKFMNTASNYTDTEQVSTAENVIGSIIYIMQIISVGVATIMLIVLGMKYIMSSIDERAEIKKHATVYVIGAIIIFGANGIVAIIRKFSKNIKYTSR